MLERKYFHDLFGGEAEAGSVAETVILINDPLCAEPLSGELEQVVSVADHYEFRVMTGSWMDLRLTLCSTGIGGGSTTIALDNLVRLGARTILYMDASQSWTGDTGTWVATGAIRQDGASLDYARPEFPAAVSSEVLMAVLASSRELGIPVEQGLLWASAGPIRAKQLRNCQIYNTNLKASGSIFGVPIITTPPEFATVLTLGTLYRLRAGAVFTGVTSPGEIPGAGRRLFQLALNSCHRLQQWDKEKAQRGWKMMTPAIIEK